MDGVDKILSERGLSDSFKMLQSAQLSVQQEKHRIIKYLVENEKTEFFSVNWARLDRFVNGGRRESRRRPRRMDG